MAYPIIHVPRDYDRFPEFRLFVERLTDLGGNECMASHIFIRLWCELSFLSFAVIDPAPPFACIPEPMFVTFVIGLRLPDNISPMALRGALISSHMMTAKDDGHLFCRSFLVFNEMFESHIRLGDSLGSDAAAFKCRRSRYSREQDRWKGMGAPEVYFTDVDGVRISTLERNRIDMLVRIIDSIMGRVKRADRNFGVGLIQDAARVVRKHDSASIDKMLFRLQRLRTLIKCPRTSEWILANWAKVLDDMSTFPEDLGTLRS